jgi:hypothetical protein
MFATIGCITPEVDGKLPGLLSTFAGFIFADVPQMPDTHLKGASCRPSRLQGFDFLRPCKEAEEAFRKLRCQWPSLFPRAVKCHKTITEMLKKVSFSDVVMASCIASPPQDFENEISKQDPDSFWDPAGLTVAVSVVSFARCCLTELKHGRVAMLATMVI